MLTRPSKCDKEIKTAAAKFLVASVTAWLNTCGDEDYTEEDITEDLVKAVPWEPDGYDFAKNLENQGYSPNSELVEILDNYSFYLDQVEKEAVQKWVKENNITLAFEKGQYVRFKLSSGKESEGRINDIHPELGRYIISKDGCEVGGWVINKENILGLTEPPINLNPVTVTK